MRRRGENIVDNQRKELPPKTKEPGFGQRALQI